MRPAVSRILRKLRKQPNQYPDTALRDKLLFFARYWILPFIIYIVSALRPAFLRDIVRTCRHAYPVYSTNSLFDCMLGGG